MSFSPERTRRCFATAAVASEMTMEHYLAAFTELWYQPKQVTNPKAGAAGVPA